MVVFLLAIPLHTYLRANNTLYNFIFSPNDLYQTLAVSNFDLTKKGKVANLDFTHKYPGNHWVAVIVENPIEVRESYSNDFEVNIEIRKNDRVLLTKTLSDSSFWFHGGKGRSGFALFKYKVPKDLPMYEGLSAKLVVKKNSPEFKIKYGEHKLEIGKFSDG